jgi:hypothetical protein
LNLFEYKEASQLVADKEYEVRVKVPSTDTPDASEYTYKFSTVRPEEFVNTPFIMSVLPPEKVQQSVEILAQEEMVINIERGRLTLGAESVVLHDSDSYIWDELCSGSHNGYMYALNNADQLVRIDESSGAWTAITSGIEDPEYGWRS